MPLDRHDGHIDANNKAHLLCNSVVFMLSRMLRQLCKCQAQLLGARIATAGEVR